MMSLSVVTVCAFALISCVNSSSVYSPLPFPPCAATDIKCMKRAIRTFFHMMGQLNMNTIDPLKISSLFLSYPSRGMSFNLRNIVVYGARWTDLVDGRFLSKEYSSVLLKNDFHVTCKVNLKMEKAPEPFYSMVTLDFRGLLTNVTYPWQLEGRSDNEYYVTVGPEDTHLLTIQDSSYFVDAQHQHQTVDNILFTSPSIIHNFAMEITNVVMQHIVENFRRFTEAVPAKFYIKI